MPKRLDEISPLRPRIALKSLYLSARYRGPRSGQFPIRATWHSGVEVLPGGSIDLGGRLILGMQPHLRGSVDVDPGIRHGSHVRVAPGARFSTTGWVVLAPGAQIALRPDAQVEIGGGFYMSAGARILSKGSITIGPDSGISYGTLVMDSDFHPIWIDGKQRVQTQPVRFGRHVFVGASSIVLKGVEIGDGSVIAAGSVVTSSIPSGVVAAGAPARVVGDVRWEWE